MSNHRAIAASLAFLVLAIGVLSFTVRADQWVLPKKKKYYAPNKKFYLEVIPKKLESQLKYFEDKSNKKENAGALPDTKDNQARAVFYARASDGSYAQRAKFPLVNEVSPVSAVVSNDGKYFVTFDNWHTMGYGDDVVVLYRSDGSVIKKFGLDDLLTKGDVEVLPRSVSSIWWGGGHYIDEAAGHLVLRIILNGMPWGETAKFHDLKIELATGRTLDPKRDLLPQTKWVVTLETPGDNLVSDPGKPVCATEAATFDSEGALHVTTQQLLEKAKEQSLPPYPPIAKAAHAEGTVVIEILVAETGEVICARPLSGHPLLLGVSTPTALKWKFEPFASAGHATKAVGSVLIKFSRTVSQ